MKLWFIPHPQNNHKARLLKHSGLTLLLSLLLLFQISLNTLKATRPGVLGTSSVISSEQIIQLPTLRTDPQLTAAAQQKAADMFNRDYWAHITPTGEQPWSFISSAGYTYLYAGENLARDFSDPQAVVSAWLASPSHRDNLLNPNYQDLGVSVQTGLLNGVQTTLVVQMFGQRRSESDTQTPIAAIPTTAIIITPSPTPVPTLFRPPSTPSHNSPPTQISPTPIIPAISQPSPPPSSPAYLSPFSLSKTLSLGIASLLLIVLAVDLIIINHKKVTRLSSRSMAHLILIITLSFILVLSQPGTIL
jgi:hypothetical protein